MSKRPFVVVLLAVCFGVFLLHGFQSSEVINKILNFAVSGIFLILAIVAVAKTKNK